MICVSHQKTIIMNYLKSISFLLAFLFSIEAFALEFFFSHSQFMTPDKQHYVETYVSVPIASLTIRDGEDNKRSAAVDITITFSKDGEVVKFDKYRLNSPELTDTSSLNFNLLDVKRFPLDVGDYELEVSYADTNEAEAYGKFTENLHIADFREGVVLSEVTLLESMKTSQEENQFSKNGLELIPYVFPYYDEAFSTLRFYFETYNTDFLKDSVHLVTYYVSKSGREQAIGQKKGFKKQKGQSINMILGEFDVSDLNSGNYDLVIEVRDTDNELIAQSMKFFQLNIKKEAASSLEELEKQEVDLNRSFLAGLDAEKALYYCKALEPIAADDRQAQFIRNLTNKPNEEVQKRYLYNFWTATAPQDPEKGFLDYMKVVDHVEEAYSTSIKHGFETDRGWTYLKYGRPNQVQAYANFDPGALPYEIWQYYVIQNGQTNVQFVFYSPQYSTNDYELLHSDARGEINDPRWKMRLYDKTNDDHFDLDQTEPTKRQGSRVGDF